MAHVPSEDLGDFQEMPLPTKTPLSQSGLDKVRIKRL